MDSSICEIVPNDILALLDQTTMMDDNMSLVPTSIALRGERVQDLLERAVGRKPKFFAPHPISAQIEFTQRCNLTCDFCYNSSSPDRPDELDLVTLERVCKELIDINITELIISGGEPLTRPKHLELILNTFKPSNIPIHLLTNGVLLTDKILGQLKNYNVLTIQISLDGGDLKTHDRQRGKVGAWEKTYDAICRASAYGFHTIVSCTLTKDNANTIEEFIDYCYLAGAKEVAIGDLISWGRAEYWMYNGACTNDQYDNVARVLQKKDREYKGQMRIRMPVNMLYYICHIRIKGQEGILIRGNGDVMPHCVLSNYVVGNIYNNSIREIWDTRLKSISDDPHLIKILKEHEIVQTEDLKQLRCFKKLDKISELNQFK